MSTTRKRRREQIHAAAHPSNAGIIAMQAPIKIQAADSDGPAKFDVLAYTGGAIKVPFYDLPVVVDLASLRESKSLVANLDHDRTKRVGNVTAVENDKSKNLRLSGTASASTSYRDEVVNSAKDGFVWQASIEAFPGSIEEVNAGDTVTVNDQEFSGPLFVARNSLLQGFAFVSHGADDNTTVKIAATTNKNWSKDMNKELKAWIESLGLVVADLSETQVEKLTADFAGRPQPPAPKPKTTQQQSLDSLLEAEKAKRATISRMTEISAQAISDNPASLETIEAMSRLAIEGEWEVDKFELELLRATRPQCHTLIRGRQDSPISTRILEAAVAQAGRLKNIEKRYDDQTLQAAHDQFKGGIGLSQLFLIAAEANGYQTRFNTQVTLEAQRAAFGMTAPRHIQGSAFSTVSIPDVLSNVANKFLMDGWNSIDLTPLNIAAVRSVRDFKTITTVSLTGDLTFKLVGAGGEISHGEIGDESYTNKADTYARLLAITRTDLINDDLGALTSVPKKLGRGSALKLNDIFWTAFLNNSAVFTTARINENTGVADMTVGGLAATETIFMDQIDPDGNPLGIAPSIIIVPTALKADATTLMTSERLIDGTSTGVQGSGNIWRDRFRVESSPYMSNSSYTGNSALAWYMIADPADLPLIEIVALGGRVEPVIETADADFNVLGVQMRGYSDIGVNYQEYRAGVRADGGAS